MTRWRSSATARRLCKEPAGGHPKLLHQDASYFEHKYEGPVGVLCYTIPTTVERGALHVVPGSHRLEILEHVDTESHLGLDPGAVDVRPGGADRGRRRATRSSSTSR